MTASTRGLSKHSHPARNDNSHSFAVLRPNKRPQIPTISKMIQTGRQRLRQRPKLLFWQSQPRPLLIPHIGTLAIIPYVTLVEEPLFSLGCHTHSDRLSRHTPI